MDRFRLVRPHLEEGVPLTRLAQAERIALRTAQRWLQRYRTQGLAGLARQPRADRGTTVFPPELIGLIEGLALERPPSTAAAIHRRVTAVALALLARTLPAPAAEQHPWPTCANFRTQHDAQITDHTDQSDPFGLAASQPVNTLPCGGNVAFGTPPLISCAALDALPNGQAALQLLDAYTLVGVLVLIACPG